MSASLFNNNCPFNSRSELEYAINHVFFPVHHPQHDDYTHESARALVSALHRAAQGYHLYISVDQQPHWDCITKMLEKLQATLSLTPPWDGDERAEDLYRNHAITALRGMKYGDVLAFPTNHYRELAVFRNQHHCILFEYFSFSYCLEGCGIKVKPELALEIPNHVFKSLQTALAGSLALGMPPAHILREGCHPVEPKSIIKHIGPTCITQQIHRRNDSPEWSRGRLWFFVRLIIQSSLCNSSIGDATYKTFLLFFMCNLTSCALKFDLSCVLLHSLPVKILRRFGKLGSPVVQWLHNVVLDTCTILSETLDRRWQEVQVTQYLSLPWCPSELNIVKDTQLSLSRDHNLISPARNSKSSDRRLAPNWSIRHTLRYFLSSEDPSPLPLSHWSDIYIALYDFERAVEEDIDDWVTCVTDVDVASKQLGNVIPRYYASAWKAYANATYKPRKQMLRCSSDPDLGCLSIMFLTVIELWIALDKLLTDQIPILADYSPELPVDLFCLFLYNETSVPRLYRARQYILARYDRAHPQWSVLSNNFTEDSFPCRFYNNSALVERFGSRAPNASDLFHMVSIFEQQCPVSLDTWRSVTCWISGVQVETPEDRDRVLDIPAHSYLGARSQNHSLDHSFLLYKSRAPRNRDRLYYAYDGPSLGHPGQAYRLPNGRYADSGLHQFLADTNHPSNHVFANLLHRHPSLSSNEFIAFAHLRSGGSLQWLNILYELRNRTLDFRHQEVYLLLAHAAAQVGPLDDAGHPLWHQETQDPSFCAALLDELESLFVDVGAGPLSGPPMAIISLISGVLTSSYDSNISDRALQILRSVRKRTYEWVHELLYNIKVSPMIQGSRYSGVLRDLAVVCRSTFDVNSAMRHKLFHSAHDIEVALSCSMLMQTIALPDSKESEIEAFSYTQLIIGQDIRRSLNLEKNLRDAINADASDVGVDRAIQTVWPAYRPGPHRSELRAHQWLASQTAQIGHKRSQAVYIDLLSGSILVDGQQIGNHLPSEVTDNPTYRRLFGRHSLTVTASDFPGMDFVAIADIHNHQVHFSTVTDSGNGKIIVVICAERKDTGDIFQLVPQEKLDRYLPKLIVEDHIHWLNLATSSIEVRPIGEPWKQSSDNWMIRLNQEGGVIVMRGGEVLVDKQSPTWAMVSSQFKPLEDPENLIITTQRVDPSPTSFQLFVALPRYGLSFFTNTLGQLESRDFKDMVYDEEQYIGTLLGLVNRLVLRSKSQIEEDLIPKYVLIPLSYSYTKHDLSVHLNLPLSGPVGYHTYQVDKEQGCLGGIVDFESRLYLAHLHAITGLGGGPDPLTGRTGLEEAISLICLAGTRQAIQKSHRLLFRSPQMQAALAKIEYPADHDRLQAEIPTGDAILREAYQFPSEVVAPKLQLSTEWPYTSLYRLFHERLPPELSERCKLEVLSSDCILQAGYHTNIRDLFGSPLSGNIDVGSLPRLFSSLQIKPEGTAPPFQSQYLSRLHHSACHFQSTNSIEVAHQNVGRSPGIEKLRKHYVQCRNSYAESLNILNISLGPQTEFERILSRCSQWPRITPFTLFRCLASTSPIKIPDNWKNCLISLIILALDLQRARRLLKFAVYDLQEELNKELENKGCDGWHSSTHPDWLLIQLQGNFLIRRIQAEVAKEMMSPHSRKNTALQLNMGEGKSSVIIPICAAVLADGNRLVRVIVPKPQIPHILQVLINRLSGLVNKPVYHLTFTRNHRNREISHSNQLVPSLRDTCGIVVMQPEHVLSLKLACVEMCLPLHGVWKGLTVPSITQRPHGSGGLQAEHVLNVLTNSLLESQLAPNTYVSALAAEIKQSHKIHDQSGESPCAGTMESPAFKELQKFMENHTWDIIDEIDDVLRPQFHLFYAIGHQHPLEGSPDRWLITQQVLQAVKRHANLLSTHNSPIIRCDTDSPGSFPFIHILQAEGGNKLIWLIAQDVLDGRINRISLHSELGLKGAIREFLLRKNGIHPDTVKMVEIYARQTTLWGALLLLRGLLAHNILLIALTQRRWRVNYGLDPSSPPRTQLAIPYRAKDTPAERAEFGHPDIAIILTCLSYYYGGLSEEQLKISFELLLQADDPPAEYTLWLQCCGSIPVPNTLTTLSGVNIQSSRQWTKFLVPLFSRNQRTIDLYLSGMVFPNYTKEFLHRISGSYWDIAERKKSRRCLVTGFSGTNDGQYLLPTSVTQYEPPSQVGTNAMVLAYLLQPENHSYMVTSGDNGKRWTTFKLLEKIASQDPEIRVLIDVGAQILDVSNLQLAKAWLDCTSPTEIAGAIYFNEEDELMVLERTGKRQPLSRSPFAQQLQRCVTYLDDAHTRGTDLPFPRGFRAAVTLGRKVTKDRLVQGCMRMRKLGHGHSVMFFAPHNVDQKIRGLISQANQNLPVSTADILCWAIHETWIEIQRQAPHWARHGINHQSRYEAWSRFSSNEVTQDTLADVWIQQEQKTLADMYMPRRSSDFTPSTRLPSQIREHCENLGVLSIRDFGMDEEQEREVSREVEREREEGRPSMGAPPLKHLLHPDVAKFVTTGILPSFVRSIAFRHILATGVSNVSGGSQPWSPHLLATADFCATIRESEGGVARGCVNDYLRHVQWVLSGKKDGQDVLVLVSPFEVEWLMPEIRISKHVYLHVYTPRTTKRMKPSDNLRWYTIPPLPIEWSPPWALIDQLNLFAGQLYLSNFTAYTRVCRFLGVHTVPSRSLLESTGTVVKRNWLSNESLFTSEIKNRFMGTPLPLAMLLLAIRRGMNFAGTDMGRILDGWPTAEEDFEGRSYFVDLMKVYPSPGPSQRNLELGMPPNPRLIEEEDENNPTMSRKREPEFGSAGVDDRWKRRRLIGS